METDDARKLAHRNDPDTSMTAAERATHRSIIKEAIVSLLLARGPATAFELRDLYFDYRARRDWPWCQAHSVDRRLSELHRDGVVEDSGVRRYSAYNRPAVVWALTRPKALDDAVGERPPDGAIF
jgi:hypothetical protein